MHRRIWLTSLPLSAALLCCSCEESGKAARTPETDPVVVVGYATVHRQALAQTLTLSAELVPFQEIDVYAKVAGYVKELYVDYGTRVRRGQLLARLEVPELEAQLRQDQAEIQAQTDQMQRAAHEAGRVQARHDVLHLQFQRLAGVAKAQPGLVAQQEVDNAQGDDLAAESQLEAARGAYAAAQSQLAAAQAHLARDQALFDYSKITAPFDGVVTKRYANLGALMQAGTTSTEATPLVRLSQEDLYRLVIPVPESAAGMVREGLEVGVRIPALGRTLRGKIARFAVDVSSDTRTMRTEVDVPNPDLSIMPGLYAEADLPLSGRKPVLTLQTEAVDHSGAKAAVLVIDRQNRLQRREVQTGPQTDDQVEIARGLGEGERVVVSDRSGLRPGQVVEPRAVEPGGAGGAE